MTALSSEEVNYLVARYLEESGFNHSHFAFMQETDMSSKDDRLGAHVLPGALIKLLHKGVAYLDCELHVNTDGTERKCDAPWSILEPHVCSLSEPGDARPSKRLKRDEPASAQKRDKKLQRGGKPDKSEKSDKPERSDRREKGDRSDRPEDRSEKNAKGGKGTREKPITKEDPMDVSSDSKQADAKLVSRLSHTSMVLRCAWNPAKPETIATGGADGSLRLWKVSQTPRNQSSTSVPALPVPETWKSGASGVNTEISALEWAPNGELFAAATVDGRVLLRKPSGEFMECAKHHTGAIYTLAWNAESTFFATGSHDKTLAVWQASNGTNRRIFDLHSGPVMTVDWLNQDTLATGSADNKIFVFAFGDIPPLKEFTHQGDVNKVVWDPTKTFLASCSDDHDAKIWDLDNKREWTAKGHTDEVRTCQWSPGKRKLLVTGSADGTARLWDVKDIVDDVSASKGKFLECLHKIDCHESAVSSVAFSYNGRYLATASADGRVNIWSAAKLVKAGLGNDKKESLALLKWYQIDNPDENEFIDVQVRWNTEGDQLAISYGITTVAILHVFEARSTVA